MDVCRHLNSVRLALNHSILNPEKWLCAMCGTTESVWACLSCSNVACGRFNEEHALTHFKDTNHPIAMEVNDRYVYCYACDEYVMNDNSDGIITLLRSALSAIETQSFDNIETQGQRLLRSYSYSGIESRTHADENDKLATADCHYRKTLMRTVFVKWHMLIWQKHMAAGVETPAKKARTDGTSPSPSTSTTASPVSPTSPSLRKRTLIPGVTGLRNLGNTCYMNSILQALGHIEDLRRFFLHLSFHNGFSPPVTPQRDMSPVRMIPSSIPVRSSNRVLKRLDTLECFKHLNTPSAVSTPKFRHKEGGLSGGGTHVSSVEVQPAGALPLEEDEEHISLSQELHGLLRVLWSGKWAQVSPHAFLQAVWSKIPAFKGHSQHDAQEFLCELVEKVESEASTVPQCEEKPNMMAELFQGELTSQVKCLACRNVSSRHEPFMDLSLEFPERYQFTSTNKKVANDVCQLTEMLDKFTETETLESQTYSCDRCNSRRRLPKSKIYTDAQKRFVVNKLPPVLRLHLKRFRWSGRNHREKISTHVAFEEELNMTPYCTNIPDICQYRLTSVVIHHGRGFGSGHYTSYCYNSEAESWIHCNDSKVELCPLKEVLASQAYILFYTQDYDVPFEDLAVPLDSSCADTSLSCSQVVDEEITFNFKQPSLSSSLTNSKWRDSSSCGLKRRRSTLW
ncbi:ubiquitin carboxyl-terminal hydrolase 44-like [Haliotis rufescens]|uniref:ubiquitin carboxyl-terminal hydrolase 44-like n=1 Tax=Haliotis rufescens TaxID=6454 RepID=UPI00201EC706|nr:ubiquitin carboxyl-terminal hydrolase 44-like [Haliotis rufescens]